MGAASAAPIAPKPSEMSHLERLISYYVSRLPTSDLSTSSVAKLKRRLRRVAYNALLDRQPGPHCCNPIRSQRNSLISNQQQPQQQCDSVRLSIADYAIDLRLRSRGQNDRWQRVGDKLESLADSFLSDKTDSSAAASALQFLLLLADSTAGSSSSGFSIPRHGTTISSGLINYRHYPVDCFESGELASAIGPPIDDIIDADDKSIEEKLEPSTTTSSSTNSSGLMLPDVTLFQQQPGVGLTGIWTGLGGAAAAASGADVDGDVAFGEYLDGDGASVDDWSETGLRNVATINRNNSAWQRRQSGGRHGNQQLDAGPVSPDDGYTGSTGGNGYNDRLSPQLSLLSDQQCQLHHGFDEAATGAKPLAYNWLNRGRPLPPELPYLTEAGPAAFDSAAALLADSLSTAAPSGPTRVSFEKLCLDAQALMLGLTSGCFPLLNDAQNTDDWNERLTIREGLTVDGCTPDSLARLMRPMLEAGRRIRRLRRLLIVGRQLTDVGQIASAFLGCLDNYLNLHESLVLSAYSPSVGPIQLAVRMRPYCRQVGLIYSFCCPNDSPDEFRNVCLLGGLKLLHRLEAALAGPSPQSDRLLLAHFLVESSRPYLRRLHDWAHSGLAGAAPPAGVAVAANANVEDDNSEATMGEFPVVCHPDYANLRSVGYWRSAYSIGSKPGKQQQQQQQQRWPLLPAEASTRLFFCGKSVNLLRLLAPKHPVLLTSADGDSMPLALRLSLAELEHVANAAEHRLVQARQAEWSARRERAGAEARRDARLRALAAAAREASAREFEALRAGVGERRRAELQAKREQVEALKREAERARQAKAEAAAAEAAETERALAAVERERRDLEDRVRQELMAKYARLTDEAAKRELRALWRLQRRRLDERRAAVLAADDARWKQAMIDAADAPSSVDDSLLAIDNRDVDDGSVVQYVPSDVASSEVTPFDVAAAIEKKTSDVAAIDAKPSDVAAIDAKPSDVAAIDAKPSDVAAIDAKPSDVAAINAKPSDVAATHAKPSDVAATHAKPSDVAATHVKPSDVAATYVKPSDVAAIDAKPSDVAAIDAEPSDVAAIDAKPSDVAAIDAKPSDVAAIDAKPSDVAAIGAKPSDVAAIDAKPSDVAAIDAKPSDVAAAIEKKTSDVAAIGAKPSDVAAIDAKPSDVAATDAKPSDVAATDAKEPSNKAAAKAAASDVKPTPTDPSPSPLPPRPQSPQPTAASTRLERFRQINSGHRQSASRESDTSQPVSRCRNPHGHPSDQSAPMTRLKVELDKDKEEAMTAQEDVEAELEMLINDEELQDADESLVAMDTSDAAGWTLSVMKSFQQLCDGPPISNLLSMPRHQAPGSDAYFTSTGSFVATDAVERLSIATLAARSLWTPLQVQASIVNSALVTQLLYESNGGLLRHLHRLRRFCFLADGRFTQTFVELATAESEASTSPDALARCLRLAEETVRDLELTTASSSSSVEEPLFSAYQGAGCITFGAIVSDKDSTATKSSDHAAAEPDTDIGSINVSSPFDLVSFHYEADWPANLILTDSAITRYTRLMRLLLRLSLALGQLTSLFSQLRRDTLVHRLINNQQARWLQLWRHELEHAVKALGSYACHQTLDVCWSRLAVELDNAADLEALRTCHDGFLRRCLQRCLLEPGGERLLKHALLMLSLAERFCRVYRGHAWTVVDNPIAADGCIHKAEMVHPQFEALAKCRDMFRQNARFLFGLLARLRDRAAHLDELVLRLDFNCYYGLATSSSSGSTQI